MLRSRPARATQLSFAAPGHGNGEIGRQAADLLLDRCLCDGVGDRNGNSQRFLAAAAVAG